MSKYNKELIPEFRNIKHSKKININHIASVYIADEWLYYNIRRLDINNNKMMVTNEFIAPSWRACDDEDII